MFFEEGWATLSDVTADVVSRVQSFHAAHETGASEKRILADAALSVWEICDAATKAGVTSVDGRIVSASKALITWDDPRRFWNRHIDLRAGNVGSSMAAEETVEAKRARYGAFLYLPLVIPLNGVQSSLTFLEEELSEDQKKDPEVVKVAAQIVAEVEAGKLITRDIARRRIATGLSRRKFKIAWTLATDKQPGLRRDLAAGA